MTDPWAVLMSIDWAPIVGDVLVPAAAIIVSTLVAVALARQERRDNRASLRRERLLAAATPLFEDFAQLVSLHPLLDLAHAPLQGMRAHIAVFRAALDVDDSLVSDWLALRHREGMQLWRTAIGDSRPPDTRGDEPIVFVETHPSLERAQAWANVSIQQLQGWLSGDVPLEWFRQDGARVLAKYGTGDPGGGASDD